MTLLEAKRLGKTALKRRGAECKNGVRRLGGKKRCISWQRFRGRDRPNSAGAEVYGDKLVQSNWYGECAAFIKSDGGSHRRCDIENKGDCITNDDTACQHVG